MTTQGKRRIGRKLGLIIPSVNTTIEPDFAWAAPPDISVHAARVMLHATTPEGLRAMNREVEGAARLIGSINPDVVAFACTSGTFLDGEAALDSQIAAIAALVQCPVIATSRAMIEACRALGLRRIALVTPYLDVINEAERAFFSHHGFDIVACEGLGLSGKAIREVGPRDIMALVRRADVPEADGVFVSCTDFRILEVAEILERVLGKPVLTSNQVTLWAVLRALKKGSRIPGLGRLLAA
jgi:maleate isomerase